MQFKGQACHKLILAGEHLVVHNYPALAVPLLDKLTICLITDTHNQLIFNGRVLEGEEIMGFRNEMQLFYHLLNFTNEQIAKLDTMGFEFDLQVESGIGFGSSASFALAIIRALAEFSDQKFSSDELLEMVHYFEKIYHGNPSGIDHTTIVLEKPILWKGSGNFEVLDFEMPAFWTQVQLENTGKPTESTKQMVDYFATKFGDLDRSKLDSLALEITNLVAALKNNDLSEFKRIINLYGEFLESIPLCTQEVITANQKSRTSGGAAKICGAGGLTAGSGIVLRVG